MATFRITSTPMFKVPQIGQIIKKAIDYTPYPDKDAALLAVYDQRKTAGIFISAIGDKVLGCTMVLLPSNPLDRIPQVGFFYSKSAEARKELKEAVVDFVKKNGYNTFWAVNLTGHSDEAWKKVMDVPNWKVDRIGGIMEFKENG